MHFLNHIFNNATAQKMRHFLIMIGLVGMGLMLSACGKIEYTNDIQDRAAYMKSVEGCWSCQAFGAAYTAVSEVATRTYEIFPSIALNILALCLAFWLLFHTIQFVTYTRTPNYVDYWVKVAQRLGRALFVAVILSQSQLLIEFVNMIVEPVVLFFIQLSSEVLADGGKSFNAIAEVAKTEASGSTSVFPSVLGLQLENLIYKIQVSFDFGFSLGLRLLLTFNLWNWLAAGFLLFFFFWLAIFFPCYLIDAILRLGFVVILSPVWLVAWVFPITAGWTKKAWDIFMASLIQILIGCIFVALLISMVEGYAQLKNYTFLLTPMYQDADPEAIKSIEKMSISGLSFFILCTYMYGLAKSTQNIAGFLSGIASTAIMSRVVSIAETAIKTTSYLAAAAAAALLGFENVALSLTKRAGETVVKEAQGAAAQAMDAANRETGG